MFPPTTGPRAAPSTGLSTPFNEITSFLQGGAPCMVPEHALAQDLNLQVNSPGGLNLYEGELGEAKKPLLSPCSSGVGESISSPSADTATCSTFDLNPQYEQSSDIWNILSDINMQCKDGPLEEVDELKPSITDLELDTAGADIFNMEDVFVDKKDMLQGPTLAQLNSEGLLGTSDMFDDIHVDTGSGQGQTILSLLPSNQAVATSNNGGLVGGGGFVTPRPPLSNLRKPVASSCATLSSPIITRKPAPSCFTTCTITTPTAALSCSSNMAPLGSTTTHKAPTISSTVQYMTFPGDKQVADPFPANINLPPLIPPASQVISANPCLNKLLLPPKTEPPEMVPVSDVSTQSTPQVVLPATSTPTTEAPSQTQQLQRGVKRSYSPDTDSNSSFESRWKDIKHILDDQAAAGSSDAPTPSVAPSTVTTASRAKKPKTEAGQWPTTAAASCSKEIKTEPGKLHHNFF